MTPDACYLAVEIERTRKPADWPRALQTVPAEQREEAEDYLRGIAARLRNMRRVMGGVGRPAWQKRRG